MGTFCEKQPALEVYSFKKQRSKKELAEAIPPSKGKFLSDAPLGIAVTINPKASNHPIEDGSAATQNMLLKVHSLGLGACWIGFYGTASKEKAKEVLNVPKDERLLSAIAIGYPVESSEKTRKELEQIRFTDKYEIAKAKKELILSRWIET